MLGVPIDGACKVFADILSIVTNITQPESTLKKKHLGIAFHFVREVVAAGIVEAYHICLEENPANPLTKSILSTEMKIIEEMFFHRGSNADK